MRVISGYLGGRKFDSPHGHRTHPMADKVRGALFNTLGDITGLTILDAFTGSGAVSIEAISRGAQYAVAVDNDKTATSTVEKNVKSLNITDKIKVINANVSAWSNNNPNVKFDIVFCDPPYDKVNEKLLLKIAQHAAHDGTIVFSLPPTNFYSLPEPGYKFLAQKNYGDAQLIFYRAL